MQREKLFGVQMNGFGVDQVQLNGGGGIVEVGGGGRRRITLLHQLQRFVQVVLDGGEGGHNCRRSEAVGDEGEIRQMTLNRLIQKLIGTRVAKWRSILVQQVHQFLGDRAAIINKGQQLEAFLEAWVRLEYSM